MPGTVGSFVAALSIVAGGITIVAGAIKSVLYITGVLRKLNRTLDDWNGEPARPGFPEGRPGVLDRMASMETNAVAMAQAQAAAAETLATVERRLAAVEAQMIPNGGGSLRDAVDRAAAAAVAQVGDRSTPPDSGAEQSTVVHA